MKILFFSPHTLLDSSSGAALCVATMLSELAKLGHSCAAVTGSVTDAENQLFARVMEMPVVATYRIDGNDEPLPVRQVNLDGVSHSILGSGVAPQKLTAMHDVVLRRFFLDAFTRLKPDVLLTYGGFTSNYHAGQYAMSKGCASVLYAASDSYLHGDTYQFDHVNMIHTVSDALLEKLNAVTPLPKVATQTFVKRADVVCAQRTPEYITFVNPIPPKGLKIAAALVRECQRRGRPYKFLFIEGRAMRDAILRVCPELVGCANLHFGNNTSDVRKIYERTAACLYPSLWFEPAGRVPIEANANGIPVLACNSGGIAQMLDGAGFLFEPSAELRDNHMAEVSPATVEQWLSVLDRLHAEPDFMADAERRARNADARYDTARMAQRFAEAVKILG